MNTKLIKSRLLAVGVLASFMTASCASGPEAADDTVREERVCLNSSLIRSFDALTDEYVYLRVSSKKHYLLTTRGRCLDLRNAYNIAISNTTSYVCSGGFGKIVYQDRLGGRGLRESCQIDTIQRVDDKEHAKQIVDARTSAPGAERGGTWTESELPEPDATEPGSPEPEVPVPESEVPDPKMPEPE